MFHIQKLSYVTCLVTRHVTLSSFFQRFKTARISYLRSFVVVKATQRPLLPLDEQATRSVHDLEPYTYVEVVSPAFDSNRLLLSRVVFVNDDKSKYLSVGFYHALNYQPLVEFGGTTVLPLVLAAEYVTVLAD